MNIQSIPLDWRIAYDPYSDLLQVYDNRLHSLSKSSLVRVDNSLYSTFYVKGGDEFVMIQVEKTYDKLHTDISEMSRSEVIRLLFSYIENEQKLKQIIDRAVKGGWDMFGFEGKLRSWNVNEQEFPYQSWLYGRIDERMVWQLKASLNDILLSKDFAKAYWGKKLLCYDCGNEVTPPDTVMGGKVQLGTGKCVCFRQFENNLPAYQFHLQQCVISDDIIDYYFTH